MSNSRRLVLIEDGVGRKIWIEVSSEAEIALAADGSGYEPASVADAVREQIVSLDQTIRDTCEMVYAGVTALSGSTRPSTVSAEFSLELGMKGKVWFVAEGNAKATIKVTAEWDLTAGTTPAS